MMDGKFSKPLDFDRRLSTMSEDIQFHTKNKKPLALTSGKKFSLSSGWLLTTHDLTLFEWLSFGELSNLSIERH